MTNSLHARNLRHMRIHFADQRLDQVVLLRTCSIVITVVIITNITIIMII